MKKFLFSLFAVLCCVATINAQLVGVVVESANDGSQKIAQGALAAVAFCPGADLTPQPAGTTTYRVYAELQDSDDFLSAMFGIPAAGTNPTCYPLTVNTTTSFFNSAIGHADGTGIIEAACGSFPDVYYDSFMTIGRELSDDPGAVGNQWSANPFTNPFTAGVGNVLGTDGAIFATNGSPNALPTGPNNRVLLGQFTTTGDLSFNINVNVFDGGDGIGGNLQYIAYEIDNTNCAVPGTALDGISLGCVFPAPVGEDGCTDVTACNYDVDATNDDGSCVFADAAACESCSGETDGTGTIVVSDADGDGVCDADEIAGCQDATACNYNMAATDDNGSCVFAVAADCESCSGETDGTGTIVVSDADGDGVCDADEIAGCQDATACNYNMAATDDNGSCVFAAAADCEACSGETDGTGTIVVSDADGDGVCDADEIAGCQDATACNYNMAATDDNGSCVFAVAADCESCSGETDGTGTIVVSDADGDGVCDADEIAGCTDAAACNFDAAATDDDGSCDFASCAGCTDPTACNFNPSATVTDNTLCEFVSCAGCTDSGACNFDASATLDDASCVFAVAADCEVCSGETDGTGTIVVEDADGDGVCDGDEIAGCQDATACNYNMAATDDDGSCVFAVAADCEVCSGETDGTGTIVVEDADGDGVCDGDEIDGCTDVTACNYDPAATEDDGSCILPDGCTDSGACNFDPAAVCDDGSCDFSCFGCTDPAANNFDPAATIDDGTCTFDPVNDSPAQAFSLGLSVSNGPCNGLSGDMADASTADAAGSATVDSDLWYTFVPFSSGARIEVNTVDFDALIEVLDAGLNTLSVEDAAAFNGSEAYHVGDLTAGDTYYIRVGSVAATAGAAPFDVCVKTLRDSRCDYGSGPYSLCGIFKADFAFADSYIFNFTSNTTGTTYTSAPQSSTFINFDQVDGMQYDDDYTVEIQTVYMTTDGAGNPVMTIVEADESCSVTIGSPITTQMSPEDNATNAGPQFLGNYIIAEEYICGVESYEWTFVNVSGEDLPIIVEGNGPTRWLQISDALNESALGQTFNVTVRANFGGGVYGDAGATQQLSIIGVVTAQDEPGIAEIAQDATRSEVVEATANVYPNPSTGDIVNINVTDIDATVELVTVDVMDNLGKVVASRVMNANNGSVQNTMNLSQLTAGMYHVRITAGDQLVNTTLMIQK